MAGFQNVRRITIGFEGDEPEAAHDAAEERAEAQPTPYTGRTSFGVNQGDQRKEAADALDKKAKERENKFLRPTKKDQALKDTATKMRDR